MNKNTKGELTDKGRLMFGAGFVFGVMFTMLILAVVTVTVASGTGRLVASQVIVTIVAGVLFAAIVGVSLYLLAFPSNRVEIPIEEVFGDDE